MRPQSPYTLDGILAIGPHSLDLQLRDLRAYAERAGYRIRALWTLLPGEDPALDAPASATPVLVFDDEIARFTQADLEHAGTAGETSGDATPWHVAHATPQPKQPTLHLPVYGRPRRGETGGDAVLCLGGEPLDRQVARLEAYAIRGAVRLQGVYVAANQHGLQQLLHDFGAARRTAHARAVVVVGRDGSVERHG